MDSLSARVAAVLVVVLSLGGCLGVPTPDELITAGIGHEDDGPEHNPGHPCTHCHSEFAFAGTVYTSWFGPDAVDEEGNEVGRLGVSVTLTDADGRSATAISNEAGNFAFTRGGEDDEPGFVRLTFEPEFPVAITIREGAVEREMRTPLRAERSCSICHAGNASERSAGRVYLSEPAP